MSQGTMVRTHLVLPEELIKDIDEVAGPRKRSQYAAEVLQAAVDKELRHRRLLKAAHEAAGSLKDVDIPGWETSESTYRWVRQLREEADRRLDVWCEPER